MDTESLNRSTFAFGVTMVDSAEDGLDRTVPGVRYGIDVDDGRQKFDHSLDGHQFVEHPADHPSVVAPPTEVCGRKGRERASVRDLRLTTVDVYSVIRTWSYVRRTPASRPFVRSATEVQGRSRWYPISHIAPHDSDAMASSRMYDISMYLGSKS